MAYNIITSWTTTAISAQHEIYQKASGAQLLLLLLQAPETAWSEARDT